MKKKIMAMVFAAMMMVGGLTLKGWGPGDCSTATIVCGGVPTGYAIVCGKTQAERDNMYYLWYHLVCDDTLDHECDEIIDIPAP